MAKRVVNYDPFTGITTYFDYDHATDTSIIGAEQDVSSLLEVNKILQNDEEYSKRGIKEGWWHYASYPSIIIEKWLTEHGVNVFNKDHQKKVLELTNRPEYRFLKTTTKMHRG